MLNAIPVFGWLLALFFNVSLAIPFWICWTACGIGAKFFYFLPPVYQGIGFWNTVGVFTCIGILKMFLPSFASATASGNKQETASAK